MRKLLCRLAVVAVMLVALPVVASAQTREFTGKVDKIKSTQIIVDNRMGDKLKFKKIDETVVERSEGSDDAAAAGEAAAELGWDDVKKGDRVTVEWKMMDNPRKAYKIVILPELEEEDE